MPKSKIDLIPEDDFRQLIQNSLSYTEVLRKIGMSHGTSSVNIIKRRCASLDISCDHFCGNGYKKYHSPYDLSEILIENSTYTNNPRLKERLLDSNLLTYECAICHNKGIWQNKPLTLQLDHINGNHHDNLLENLRLLCPNCHTQTETYGSKRGTKSKK